MRNMHHRLILVVHCVLCASVAASAYERELKSGAVRDAWFLGRNADRAAEFLKDYSRTLPPPKEGVQVERIEITTPFKAVVDRARRAADGSSPIAAEADYERQPPPVSVEVTLKLTPTFPAHTAYTLPNFQPVGFRDPGFWQAFEVRVEQRGELTPRATSGQPLYSCDVNGPCWLVGAVIRLEFDPADVASRPTRVVVVTPDEQRVETEFDLGALR
jgi:hypothetical protein